MKKILFITMILICSSVYAEGGVNNPWESYDNQSEWIAAKKKPKPVVPEPSTYGFFVIAASASLLGWRRYKSKIT